ncbi:DUF2489 domain-containing protein [Marinobacterium sp. YM272]|uniref:DUF2489 domain-containing protein n=1 Tax=Marinobacterium sp. YM272 TaxID=3421654 RepID=UPI003D7FEAA6
MSASLTYTLIAIGLVAIVVLSVVIRRQLKTAREQREQQALQARELEQRAEEQRRYLIDSIRIIASAVLHDEKMTMTEGCIRVKVMLDNLAPHLHQHELFSVIERVYQATEHIPFLEDWKALSRDEKRSYQKEMAQLEKEHGEQVRQAMTELQSYPLEQMQ